MSDNGRVALVTGAARNIGLGVSQQLARSGYRVVMTARSAEVLAEQAKILRDAGATVLAVVGDALDEHSVDAVVREAVQAYGSVDVLVNCAAARYHGPLEETSLADWHRILDTTLTGAFLFTRAAVPSMIRSGRGRIVNVAGMSGQTGAAERAALVSAKAGIMGLTRATAIEYAARGITCNAISPGLIDTERPVSLGDPAVAAAHYKEKATQIPVGRLGTVEEVAALCEYLCSDASGYVTGQVLGINGGSHV